MKKGFTLIELLAVIIVLAIVALIATPLILDVIKDSKDSAARNSAYGVLYSAKYYYADEYMKNGGNFSEYECSYNNKEGCDLLSISGEKPTSGTLSINKDGMVNGKIEFNDYVFYICNNKVLEDESSECSFIEYEKIYAISESGVITGFKTEENVSILDFIIPTVYAANLTAEAQEYIKDGKITIPEYINNIEVTGIGDNAFNGYEITEITLLSTKTITIGENSLPSTLTKLRVNSCLVDKYSLNVTIEGVGTCETNITPPTANYKCKRATELHTNGTTTYGNLGSEGVLTSGDAFDCDVNGDGTYDAETERFYYISELYNTTTKEFNSDYAVLLYYSNVVLGVSDGTNSSSIAYNSSKTNYNGPNKAITNLPTTEQWNNVTLSNTSRAILAHNGSAATYGGTLPTAFSYSGYAARLLTVQEISVALTEKQLYQCPYLLENTSYWLENPVYASPTHVYFVDNINTKKSLNNNSATHSTYIGARPAIEVLKTDIEY